MCAMRVWGVSCVARMWRKMESHKNMRRGLAASGCGAGAARSSHKQHRFLISLRVSVCVCVCLCSICLSFSGGFKLCAHQIIYIVHIFHATRSRIVEHKNDMPTAAIKTLTCALRGKTMHKILSSCVMCPYSRPECTRVWELPSKFDLSLCQRNDDVCLFTRPKFLYWH